MIRAIEISYDSKLNISLTATYNQLKTKINKYMN
jgi:hypothetical protein